MRAYLRDAGVPSPVGFLPGAGFPLRAGFHLGLPMASALVRIGALLAVLALAFAGGAMAKGEERTLPVLVGPSPEGIYEATLENGLGVLIKEVTTAPIVCVSIWYRAGTKNESNGTTGLAHLLEHMMYKGTANYGKGIYDDLLESNGGVNNATTWNDRTNYYATIAKDKVDLAMELEADRMRGALFTAKDLEDEMPVVRNEMEKGEDDPYTELDERIGSTAILEHPYHWPTIGWKSDVEAITADQMHAYYDRYYQPNNAYLVLVGDLPPETLLEKAVTHFGSIPRGPSPPPIVTKEPPQKGERRFLIRETGSTRLLGIAFRAPEGAHPDARALEVLGRILSDGKASRLHDALVESGQAVWVSAFHQPFEDPFLFFVYAMLTEEADPDQVEETIYAELRRLEESPPGPSEMDRVRKRAKVAALFSRDDIEELMFAIGEAEILGDYRLYDRYLDDLDAVTAADVQAVVGRYFRADSRTVGFYLPRGAEGGSWIARPEDDLPGSSGDETSEGADRNGHAEGMDPTSPDPAPTGPPRVSIDTDRRSFAGDPAGSAAARSAGGPTDAAAEVAPSASVGLETAPQNPGARTVRTELGNGMVLLVRESHENQTIALRARVAGGLLTEPEGKAGVAALVAETLTLGAGERDADALEERLESLGVDLTVSAGPAAIEIEVRCLSEDFGAMMDLLGEIVLHPRFAEEPLGQARRRQQAQLQAELDDTFQVAYHRALEEFYGAGSPFARFTAGTAESLESLTREDVLAYHADLLHGARWTFAVVGDVSGREVESTLARVFASMPAGEPLGLALPEPRVPKGKTPIIRLPMEDRSQVDLVFVGPGVDPGTPRRDAAYVGNVILGGSYTSRLNRILRDDEGLTYWCGSWFEDLGGKSHWVATLGVNPENVDAGLAGVEREMRRFLQAGVQKEELERAEEYAAGSFPIGLRAKSDVAAALLDAEDAGYGVDFIETYGSRMRAQTAEGIENTAPAFADPDHLVVVIAGSFGRE